MTKYIKGVKNESVFMFFEAISKIPRASGNERGMAEYLVSFAKEKGLDFYSDEANNVLIVKEATVGKFKERDKGNLGDSKGYSFVDEDDIVREVYTERSGIVLHGIHYIGWN